MSIAPQTEPIQWVTLVTLLLTLQGVLSLWRLPRYKTLRPWTIPGIAWLCHAILFYIVLILSRLEVVSLPVLFTTWSSILRLHGVSTLLGVLLLGGYYSRKVEK